MNRETLHQLIENELCQAGLECEHAATAAEVLVYADVREIHSHGAMRVECYAEHISKGGVNRKPEFRLEEIGPCSVILHVDNAARQIAAKMGVGYAIKAAQQKGIAVVGISRMSHSGITSYFVQQVARAGLAGISPCQSDPMVVSFGGAEICYGTGPLAFAASEEGDRILTSDTTTTVQTWGKVLDARSCDMPTLDTQTVNKNGAPTTDPFVVHTLLPAAGLKGYDLMMMIDILSGVSSGLSFGRQVSSMYGDLYAGCNLGQLYIIINPNFFSSGELFRQHLSQIMRELNTIAPVSGFNQVYHPGQGQDIKQRKAAVEGVEIVDDIYQYLISDALYNMSYETKNPSAQ